MKKFSTKKMTALIMASAFMVSTMLCACSKKEDETTQCNSPFVFFDHKKTR